jgi:hypothetical protein
MALAGTQEHHMALAGRAKAEYQRKHMLWGVWG